MKKLVTNKALLIRRIGLMTYDVVAILASSALGLLMRFYFDYESISNPMWIEYIWYYLPINIVTTIIIFYLFHLYQSLWTYAGVAEMASTITACILSSIIMTVGMLLLHYNMPRSYYFYYAFCLLVFVALSRFAYRVFRTFVQKRTEKAISKNVMVIGAGEAGNSLIREMNTSKFIQKSVLCVIDDDRTKIGNYIHGVKVVGGREDILECAAQYDIDEIIIAMPSASRHELKEILEICKETKCELKTLPGIYQLVNGEVNVSQLRKVDVIDLLGREPIQVDLDSIMNYVNGKVVLVTGGGGSIGSELCRQIATKNPRQLIIVDIYENSAYDIQQELLHNHPGLDLKVLIASVRNTNRMNDIFAAYRPNIVYHAAAHKHVPLMEDSPNEAIKNNVMGTWKTAQAAVDNGVDKFVMISTDKAVNPTNIMGASKRICEMIVQSYNNRSKTEFVAVRFGNVLGSNGSVIPLFKKQIQSGGPVTVTHPDIIRYFMTIPEAVSLVLQAGAYAKGGEIFILDMGEPVKILDLAKNLIRLSGYVPGEDIEIEFTGLRPGEKLYEELLMKEEGMQETANKLIHIGKPIEFDEKEFFVRLEELKEESKEEKADIKAWVKELVPTYRYHGK
ncbi:polysaccharide biosynthesis protein [bacterium C-53]|nr:polysaccharide biosynthesis protein [Lachnospiraceae bacterium]NBI01601.1 polysaccharide biosynthesis protein [Lachnospiraceae bacterium]RKJ13033.1 polysaccharide biosynthesis protein [bacterium C-53]